jgi:hypothetical protein
MPGRRARLTDSVMWQVQRRRCSWFIKQCLPFKSTRNEVEAISNAAARMLSHLPLHCRVHPQRRCTWGTWCPSSSPSGCRTPSRRRSSSSSPTMRRRCGGDMGGIDRTLLSGPCSFTTATQPAPPIRQRTCHAPLCFEGSCSCSAIWLARLQLAPRKPQRHATLSHDQRCATGSLQLLASDCYRFATSSGA